MASGWASQEYCSNCKVVGRVVTNFLYPNEFEALNVRPKDVIAYQVEDGALF